MLGAVEVDDDAGLHAVRFLVADADDLHLVGAAAQHLALAARAQLRDDAADLAGADVEHRDDAGAPLRSILLSAEPAHMLFPGFFFAAFS